MRLTTCYEISVDEMPRFMSKLKGLDCFHIDVHFVTIKGTDFPQPIFNCERLSLK